MPEAFWQFIYMGGHGGYVWACYTAAVLLKACTLAFYLRRRRALLRQASQAQQAQT